MKRYFAVFAVLSAFALSHVYACEDGEQDSVGYVRQITGSLKGCIARVVSRKPMRWREGQHSFRGMSYLVDVACRGYPRDVYAVTLREYEDAVCGFASMSLRQRPYR